MDTLGSVIDKLTTVDLKLWNNQEFLYEVRRMTFDEFKNTHTRNDEQIENLWNILKKTCDLNVQRNQLIDEIDEKIVQIIKDSKDGVDLESKYIQRKHKTL
jgi:hypothetical protein